MGLQLRKVKIMFYCIEDKIIKRFYKRFITLNYCADCFAELATGQLL